MGIIFSGTITANVSRTVPYTDADPLPAVRGSASDRTIPFGSELGSLDGWIMDSVHRPRILYVDDNPDLTDSAVEMLRLLGFEAVASYDGPHALAVAADFAPDVCVLDLNMPMMSGDELAKKLAAQSAGRKVLFVAVTARGDVESIRRMADAGVGLLFVKPVGPQDLVRVIEGYWRALSEADSL